MAGYERDIFGGPEAPAEPGAKPETKPGGYERDIFAEKPPSSPSKYQSPPYSWERLKEVLSRESRDPETTIIGPLMRGTQAPIRAWRGEYGPGAAAGLEGEQAVGPAADMGTFFGPRMPIGTGGPFAAPRVKPAAPVAEPAAVPRPAPVNIEESLPGMTQALENLREVPTAENIRSAMGEVTSPEAGKQWAARRAENTERDLRAPLSKTAEETKEALTGGSWRFQTPLEAAQHLAEAQHTPPLTRSSPIAEGATGESIAPLLSTATPKAANKAAQFYRSLVQSFGEESGYLHAARQGLYLDALKSKDPATGLFALASSTVGKEAFAPDMLAGMRRHAQGFRDLAAQIEQFATRPKQASEAAWAKTFDPKIGGRLQEMFQRMLRGEASAEEIEAGIFGAMIRGAKPEEIVRMMGAINKVMGGTANAEHQLLPMIRMGVTQQLLEGVSPANLTREALAPLLQFLETKSARALYGKEGLGSARQLAQELLAAVTPLEQAATPEARQEVISRLAAVEAAIYRRWPGLATGVGVAAGEAAERLGEAALHDWPSFRTALKTVGMATLGYMAYRTARGTWRFVAEPDVVRTTKIRGREAPSMQRRLLPIQLPGIEGEAGNDLIERARRMQQQPGLLEPGGIP